MVVGREVRVLGGGACRGALHARNHGDFAPEARARGVPRDLAHSELGRALFGLRAAPGVPRDEGQGRKRRDEVGEPWHGLVAAPEERNHRRTIRRAFQAPHARSREAARALALQDRGLARVRGASLFAASRSARSVRSAEIQGFAPLREARAHHGGLHRALASVPSFRARARRLGRSSAQRLARASPRLEHASRDQKAGHQARPRDDRGALEERARSVLGVLAHVRLGAERRRRDGRRRRKAGRAPSLREHEDRRGRGPQDDRARRLRGAHARRSEGHLLPPRNEPRVAAGLALPRGAPEEGLRGPLAHRSGRRVRRGGHSHLEGKRARFRDAGRPRSGRDRRRKEGPRSQERHAERPRRARHQGARGARAIGQNLRPTHGLALVPRTCSGRHAARDRSDASRRRKARSAEPAHLRAERLAPLGGEARSAGTGLGRRRDHCRVH